MYRYISICIYTNGLFKCLRGFESWTALRTGVRPAFVAEQATQALKRFQEFSAAGANTSEELWKAVVQLRMIL